VAEQLPDPEMRRTMLGMAEGYDKLAHNAEVRLAAGIGTRDDR
jgi:hypothetical protein